MEHHPIADLFPMLPEDELKDLAHDIKERGLLQPVVLDSEGRILDGRNRYAACALAGVEPEFETYDGDDPDGYALAVNGQRRSMTKSQKALVAAELLLSNKDHSHESVAKALGVSRPLVTQAISITTWARDMREEIMLTGTGFAEAREVAAERQEAKEIAEAKLNRLEADGPDLKALVDEGRMTVDDAIAALEAREEKARQEEDELKAKRKEEEQKQREHAARVSGSLRNIIKYCADGLSAEGLREEYARIYDPELGDTPPYRVDDETIRQAGDALLALADHWKEVRA